MAYALTDVLKSSKANVASGGGMDNTLILFLADDVQTMPARGTDNVTISTNIVMKPGKYMHKFYLTPKTVKPTFKKIKGDNADILAFECGIEGFHPGLEAEIMTFLAQHSGSKFYAILRNTAADMMYLFGEAGNELELGEGEVTWGANPSEGKGMTIPWNTIQSLPPALYTGALTLADDSTSASASASSSV